MVKIEKTRDIMDALRNKYQGPTFAFLENVSNSTGYKSNRYADAIAMCTWESRGLEIIGFEVKSSRQDWIKELKKPDKADPIASYCDSWYLVLGDVNIIQFGELPLGWGLMVPHTKTELKIVTESKRNLTPKQLDKNFLAAILRRTCEQLLPKSILSQEYQRGYSKGWEKNKQEHLKDVEDWRIARDELRKKINDFKMASGVNIDDWTHTPEKIGGAVRAVLNGAHLKELEHLDDLLCTAHNCVESIETEIKKIKGTVGSP